MFSFFKKRLAKFWNWPLAEKKVQEFLGRFVSSASGICKMLRRHRFSFEFADKKLISEVASEIWASFWGKKKKDVENSVFCTNRDEIIHFVTGFYCIITRELLAGWRGKKRLPVLSAKGCLRAAKTAWRLVKRV